MEKDDALRIKMSLRILVLWQPRDLILDTLEMYHHVRLLGFVCTGAPQLIQFQLVRYPVQLKKNDTDPFFLQI